MVLPLLYQCWKQITVSIQLFKVQNLYQLYFYGFKKTVVPNFYSTDSLRKIFSSNVSPIKFPLQLPVVWEWVLSVKCCDGDHMYCQQCARAEFSGFWEPSTSTSISFQLCLHWCHSSSLKLVTIRIITPWKLANAIDQSFKKEGCKTSISPSLLHKKLCFYMTSSIPL